MVDTLNRMAAFQCCAGEMEHSILKATFPSTAPALNLWERLYVLALHHQSSSPSWDAHEAEMALLTDIPGEQCSLHYPSPPSMVTAAPKQHSVPERYL